MCSKKIKKEGVGHIEISVIEKNYTKTNRRIIMKTYQQKKQSIGKIAMFSLLLVALVSAMGCSAIRPTLTTTTVTRQSYVSVTGQINWSPKEYSTHTYLTFAKQSGSPRTDRSNLDGSFNFMLLSGTYELTVERSGFQTYTQTIELDSSETRFVVPDITLIPES